MIVRSHGVSRDPVGALLAEAFPYQHVLRADIAADLRRCSVLLIDPPNKSFFGNLVEVAIGLSLCDQIPYLDLLRCLDHALAKRVLAMAGYWPTIDPATPFDAWRRIDSAPPARIFTAASRLAYVRSLVNDLGCRRFDAGDVTRDLLERYPRLLIGRPTEIYHTRRAFRTAWDSYSSGFHSALRSYGPAAAQLPLLDGHRHADFLLGTTLLEVKSGRLDEDTYLDELICQILTYALLARHDGHHVTHVAVYAIRYQRLLRYRIDELTKQLADAPIDLTATGAKLAALIRDRSRREPAA
ncbi:hypothetical protein [Micromonospora profundi]|uniref:Uncharacterized protein n=1 Tax=Micromonospora profundi TaxID=1420889 RepID=A0AAJ6L5I5_9ACTN|nr:hypothetical protein [Micromonospora profundi]WLS45913.1 hypothetical protein Q3V37_01075 [Micromonospora profundi]